MGITQPPTQCVVGALAPGVKRPAHKACHSTASKADFTNGGAITPIPVSSSWLGA
jgi:hypothetical protein